MQQVAADMLMTKEWFTHQNSLWLERAASANGNDNLGHKTYAYHQSQIWQKFKNLCEEKFSFHINKYYYQIREKISLDNNP